MKKAFIPMILIVIFGVVGGLTFAWYLSLKAGNFGNLTMIGKDQLTLIDVATSLESVLYGFDLVAQLSASAALYDAFSSGSPSSCGTFGGLPLYSNAQGICLPEQRSLETDLRIFFEDRYHSRSLAYAQFHQYNLSNATYHVVLSSDSASFVSIPDEPFVSVITLGAGAR